MFVRCWLGLGLVGLLTTTAVFAQDTEADYSSDELAAILSRNAAPVFGADELATILTPVATRGLDPGSGIDPGAPGSGVVPDLKVHFAFNSSQLSPAARAQLDELATAIEMDPLSSYRFRIGGHTDAAGSDEYNEWLSRERATAVTSYLLEQHGIAGGRLQPVGFGERELALPEKPNDGANRRVEIVTLN